MAWRNLSAASVPAHHRLRRSATAARLPEINPRFHDTDAELDGLYGRVAAAGLQPLWTQEGLMPRQPSLGAVAQVWRFADVEALLDEAAALVGTDRGGDRRVLAFANAGLDGAPYATPTLWAAYQRLNPGESAPAHRHTPSALRFVLDGHGVCTTVDGVETAMEPGDLVLTPAMCWHEHRSSGHGPMVWFDGLDIPLVRSLDAVFFEPGPARAADPPPFPLRYARSDVERLLDERAGSVSTHRYARVDGSDVLPTIRCEMHRVGSGSARTTPEHVGSSVLMVFAGSGRVDWSSWRGDGGSVLAPGDVVAVPSWVRTVWRAEASIELFEISDAPVIESLGLARQAPGDGAPCTQAGGSSG